MQPRAGQASAHIHGSIWEGYRVDMRRDPICRGKQTMKCHQCRHYTRTDQITFCGHVAIDHKSYATTCTKRYCEKCLWANYLEKPSVDPATFGWSEYKCPGCRNMCSCARCRVSRNQRGMDHVQVQ